MVPAAGALELEHQRSDDVPASRRHTELLSIPKVDRKGKAATPAIRPGDTSTPATGTKSRTERKEEKKSARKEEKRNRKLEKSARKAEESEAGRDPVRRKLDAALKKEERVPEEGLEMIILDSGSDASLLPCDHPEAGKVSSENTGVLLEDAQGNQIKSAGIVTAVIDIEQGNCWTAPSISENFIVSEATNILLSMGRILKNGWKLEYDPRISAEEQTRGAQHYLTVSSMVLVSPDGRAKARIFYKRNSCCLLGRISVVRSSRSELPESTRGTGNAPRQGSSRSSTDSWTAVERSVSVKVPNEFTELLDSTPNGKWTIVDDGTPFIVYQGTTFMDPKGAFPGWKW